jgi:beta-N-acetylhexosaminidase
MIEEVLQMKDLSARELVGQRIAVGFPGIEIEEELKDLICNYKIGNIILFKHNISSNAQVKKLCEDLQQLVRKHTGHDPFIAIDQEGGMVTRLDQDGVNMPGAMAIAATGKIENAYQAGKLTAMQLKTLGINFNLAPSVDVNSNRDNPVIGVRSFGDIPDRVAEYAVAMTKGLTDGGVLACAKHFPGHGDTNVDSHLGLPLIDKSLEELEQCELIPFREVIDAGIPAVMTTHILFPRLEEEKLPATMSYQIITGLLRERLGYQGLIVSDCMEMSAIKQYYGTVEGVKKAVKAGVDLVFISHSAEMAREASDALTEALEKEEIRVEDMIASVDRILKTKQLLGREKSTDTQCEVNLGKDFAFQLLKDSITPVQMPTDTLPELGAKPLFIGAPLFRATNISNHSMEKIHFADVLVQSFGGTAVRLTPNPTETEVQDILQDAEKYSSIVIGTYNGHLYQGQLDLIRQASVRHSRVIVFALRNPYDLRALPETVYGIAVYEYTAKSLEVIVQLLEHQFTPTGRLPVKIG